MERKKFRTFVCLFFLNLANAQVSPSFNDWSARGVEQEAAVLYRFIDNARYYLNEIVDDSEKRASESLVIYLRIQKQIYNNTRTGLNNAASLATEAGYPKCVAKARVDVTSIVGEYQAQLRASNEIFEAAVSKFRASAEAAKASLSAYTLENEIAALRGCNTAVNKQSPNLLVDCYKKVLQDIAKKLQTVNSTLQSIETESETVKKASGDLQTNINKMIAQSQSVTEKAVSDTLKCANLDSKSPLQVTLEQIAKINATTADYLSTNTNLLDTAVNNLKLDLSLAQSVIGNNMKAGVQPFLPVGKYLTLLNLPADKEETIRNGINTRVQNTITELNTSLSDRVKLLNELFDRVQGINAMYRVTLGYVSEKNLTKICVPKDRTEQAAEEEEIKKCLVNLFLQFSNSSLEAKTSIDEQILTYNVKEKETLSTITNDVPAKMIDSQDKIEKYIISSLISYSYDPENILQLIEQHFSLPKYKIVLQNQQNIKSNLFVVKRSAETVLKNLDYEIESALSRVPETIEVIKILNPNYNVTALNNSLLKIKTELKNNITSFVNKKYSDVKTFAEPALLYNYNSELDALLANVSVCLPVDLLKLINCFEPKTSEYNRTLIQAIRLSENTLSDTNYITETLPAEFKAFIESIFNRTKKDARLAAIEALTKANPGLDFRKEAIIKFQDENEKRIKEGAQGPIDSTYQFSLTLDLTHDKLKLDLEDVFRPLRLALGKSYSKVPVQPITLSGKLSPCQVLPDIDQYINATIEFNRFFFSTVSDFTKMFKDIKNKTSNVLFDYVTELKYSNCSTYIAVKPLYDDCIQDINRKYEASLSEAAVNVEDTSKKTDSLFLSSRTFNQNFRNRDLKIAQSKIDKQFQILELQVKEMEKNPTFFYESLKKAQEEYQQAVTYKNNIKTSFNSSYINALFLQFQTVLSASARPINLTFSAGEEVSNASSSQQLQSLVQNSGADLILLLQNTSSNYRENVTTGVRIAFEKANNNIRSLRTKIITNNVIAQNKINNYVDFIESEEGKFTENTVKLNCKTVSVFTFKNCVQSYLDTAVGELRAERTRIEDVAQTFSNKTIDDDLNDFDQQIRTELAGIDAKLQSEIDKVKFDIGVRKSNEETVKSSFVSLNDSVLDFLTLLNKVRAMLTEERIQITKGSENFRENITALLTSKTPPTEETNKMIEESSEVVHNNTQFSEELVSIGNNFLKTYQDLIYVSLTSFDRTIKAKCFKESKTKDTFNECVQAAVEEYKTVNNEILTEINSTEQYNKNISECAKKEIAGVVSNEFKKAQAFLAD